MKTSTLVLVSLGVLLSAPLYSPAQPEKKETRSLTEGDAPPPPGPRTERRVRVRRGPPEAMELEKVTFLGVETQPVSPTLTAQLSLPKGAGLVVRHVAPDSPAANALQVHDVLIKIDDQLLIEPRQFSVLVRNHQPGDEVTIGYVRNGKPGSVKVKLGQHEQPKGLFGFSGGPDGASDVLLGGPESAPMPFERDNARRVLSLLDDKRPGEAGDRLRVNRSPLPQFRAQTVMPENSTMLFSDEKGSLEITIKDGKKSLVAKDPKGEQIFAGPINTPQDHEKLPPGVRERLGEIEGMQNFSFEVGDDFEGDVKVFRRPGQKISLPLPGRGVGFERELPTPTI
jgi:hypothetical protein